MQEQEKLAFICLGTMGYPMAGHLVKSGYSVRVYNRNSDRAADWLDEYSADATDRGSEIAAADTPGEAARDADGVLICTGNDDDLREVVFGEAGVLAGMKPGACLVDHTTVSPGIAREIAAAAKVCEIGFLDAPVSGGQAGAENGALTIMVGGEPAAYGRATAWFESYAKKHLLMGPPGSGQLTKAVNQICIAGLVQALSEGLNFAKRSGLDARKVVEVISKGAAQSWQMDNRHETMLEDHYEHGFAVDWMRKDLAIALAAAEEIGAELPITAAVDVRYAEIQQLGGGRLDTSSLMRLLE